MFYRDKNTELTLKEVEKYLEVFKTSQLPRLQKLERYYKAKNDTIMNRTFSDRTKPNNKVAHPYCAYVTDNMTSYFIGKPVTVNSKNEAMLNEINNIFNYNDSQSNDINIARDMSIYGYGIEMYWLDDDKQIRFTAINPQTVIPIFSSTLDKELLFCIRWYESQNILNDEITTYIEVYSDTKVDYFKSDSNGITLNGTSTGHNFKQCPFTIYQNNDLMESDFEKIIPIVDMLDLAVSDSANSIAYFNDAYLLFINTNGLDEEKLQTMKENRVIELEGGDNATPDAKWLIKNSNDIEMENYKKRLVDEIHKQSKVPNLNEDGMKSHVSAEAVRMSLLQTEQVVSIKESKFKKGIQRRVELITTILNMLGDNYDYREITFAFNRNIPMSYVSWADIISKLRGIVSTETLLEQLPFVTSPQEELGRLKKENEINSYTQIGDDLNV